MVLVAGFLIYYFKFKCLYRLLQSGTPIALVYAANQTEASVNEDVNESVLFKINSVTSI